MWQLADDNTHSVQAAVEKKEQTAERESSDVVLFFPLLSSFFAFALLVAL